jgi:hypothetical protein
LDYSDHAVIFVHERKNFNEMNRETRAREVKRTSDIKIAEVSTGKKKREKKPTAEATEPSIAQNLFERPLKDPKDMKSVRALNTPPVTWPKVKLL